jgi:hypothetical protein
VPWDCAKAQYEGYRWEERWRRVFVDVLRLSKDFSTELEPEEKSCKKGFIFVY